jgi:chromosome segregation ATPase
MAFLLLLPLAYAATFLATAEQGAVPAFDKVLTLLSNLVSAIDSEATADEADYQAYMSWFQEQESSTTASVTALGAKLTELGASLTELRARQSALTTEVNGLNADIDREQGALDEATEKREGEHDAFVKEQLDFDNAIAACGKAVELLKVHYGDGEPKESTKPSWMALMTLFHTIGKTGQRHGKMLPAFLQQPVDFFNADGSSLHNEHQDSTGDALNIVTEVEALAETFGEDKSSSKDQEDELADAFSTLSTQKKNLITSITNQRNTQQASLNSCSQQVSEHEGAEQIASTTLTQENTYLTNIGQQETTSTAMYQQRQADREAEKKAVQDAHKILSEQEPSLIEIKMAARRKSLLQMQKRAPSGVCRGCGKAAALLKERASKFHSQLLATAGETLQGKAPPSGKELSLAASRAKVAAGSSSDTLGPVVSQLEGLITRLDEQATAEQKHKDWCDKERYETNQKKQRHATLVSQLTTEVEDTKKIIEDKQLAVQDNGDSVEKADTDFNDLKTLREKAHADFEAELQDYKDAISALAEASTMLTTYYSSFLQVEHTDTQKQHHQHKQAPTVPDASTKVEAPDMMTVYEQKGGNAGVLAVLAATRKEFEDGKTALEATEAEQAKEFTDSEAAYRTARNALVDAGNRLTVELQTAEGTLSTAEANLETNIGEVNAADQYLTQVGASCDSLEAHFDDRKSLRSQERQAISDAIDVLKST